MYVDGFGNLCKMKIEYGMFRNPLGGTKEIQAEYFASVRDEQGNEFWYSICQEQSSININENFNSYGRDMLRMKANSKSLYHYMLEVLGEDEIESYSLNKKAPKN